MRDVATESSRPCGALRRNLLLIASYLFVLTLIAAGYQ
jgi:hypothetical protein